MRSLPRARRKAGYRAASPNRQLSLIIERNIIDVTQSENCTHVNFRLCDVYYVLFHIFYGRTLKLAKRAEHEKYAKSGYFPRPLLPLVHLWQK